MIKGDILDRILLNQKRLLSPTYDTDNIYIQTTDWPGDYPGRAMLALCSLYRSLDGHIKEQQEVLVRINKLFESFKDHINHYSYFGPLYNPDNINEQQLAGNSWYLRGLIKYYKITKNEEVMTYIQNIINYFLIPLAPLYESYPVTERKKIGGVAGASYRDKNSKWTLSSDTGAAFILLDGYVEAYRFTKNIILKSCIETIISVYEQLDFMALSCQTHATLSCARAILRFYEVHGNSHYLDLVVDIFRKYNHFGLTKDYQNFNWFNRPDTWTEPCCVVDSMIISKRLYRITKDPVYLRLLNRIYTNGIRTFQRDNGGAGCSLCTYPGHYLLASHMYEAWFCCTMRLAEGLWILSLLDYDNVLMIPNSYECSDFGIDVDLYSKDEMIINFKNDKPLSIYVPYGFRVKSCSIDYILADSLLTLNPMKPCFVTVQYEIDTHVEAEIKFYGDMILSKKVHHVDKIYNFEDGEYSYIYNSSKFNKEEIEKLEQYLR